MEKSEAIQIFNNAIKNATNADQIAKIELAREFCTNERFRKNLSDYMWNRTNG